MIAIGLFLLCTVPFWTSNIIRMISWIPLLGKQGLVNQALMGLGIVDDPVEWLLFSDFSVVVSYVHLFTLFMIVPIFNSMARIDKALVEAARDAGASSFRIMWEVIVPLSRSGIALGSIFVIVLVMGDFFVIKVMSGGQQRVGRLLHLRGHQRAALPVRGGERRDTADRGGDDGDGRAAGGRHPQGTGGQPGRSRGMARSRRRVTSPGPGPSIRWRRSSAVFVLFLYGPMFCIYILSFQGPNASLVFPMQGVSLHWFEALFGQARTGDVGGAFARSLPLALIILSRSP